MLTPMLHEKRGEISAFVKDSTVAPEEVIPHLDLNKLNCRNTDCDDVTKRMGENEVATWRSGSRNSW
jgi:hypothetical protein